MNTCTRHNYMLTKSHGLATKISLSFYYSRNSCAGSNFQYKLVDHTQWDTRGVFRTLSNTHDRAFCENS